MRSWLLTGRRRAPGLVLVSLLCVATAGFADEPCTKTFVWDGTPGNVSWHVDTNWSPPGVPGGGDVACILEPGMYQVEVDQPVTVAGLRLDDGGVGNPKLRIVRDSFTLNGEGFVAGDTKLKVNDGAVLRTDEDGWLEVRSKLVIEGGTVEVDVHLYGHLNWWGWGSITGTLYTYPGCSIEVEDPPTEAHLTIGGGFVNECSMAFNDSVVQSLTVASGPLVNAAGGTISTKNGVGTSQGVPELRAELDNRGAVLVSGLDLRLNGDGVSHVNQGKASIQVTGAELEIDLGSAGATEASSNFTNYGTTTVATGGTIRIIGSAGATEASSNFTNYGTTTVATGGTIRIIGSAGADSTSTPMRFVNLGFVDIEQAGTFELVDAVFDNPEAGQLAGSGLLDVTLAAGVTFDGTLSPGQSPGIFTVDGDIPLGNDTRLAVEIGGAIAGSGYDRLDVSGLLGAGGSLDVSLVDPYQPTGGERYEVLTYGALSGWFAEVDLPTLMHLLAWSVDVGATEVGLEVVCQGTQLGIQVAADRDPVSVNHEVVYLVRVANQSSVSANQLVVSGALPTELLFRPDLSSPECVVVGHSVECTRSELPAGASWHLELGAEPLVTGLLDTTGSVGAWECDTEPSDDEATATIRVVAAEPCDANDDQFIDSDDLEPAAAHIFGVTAPGNPDCRVAGGVTADDLAAIIEASQ